jgi:hypothetical protein
VLLFALWKESGEFGGVTPCPLALVENHRQDRRQLALLRLLLERLVPDAAHVLEQPKAHPGVGLRLVLEDQVEEDPDLAPLHLHSVEQVGLALTQRLIDEARLHQRQG